MNILFYGHPGFLIFHPTNSFLNITTHDVSSFIFTIEFPWQRKYKPYSAVQTQQISRLVYCVRRLLYTWKMPTFLGLLETSRYKLLVFTRKISPNNSWAKIRGKTYAAYVEIQESAVQNMPWLFTHPSETNFP